MEHPSGGKAITKQRLESKTTKKFKNLDMWASQSGIYSSKVDNLHKIVRIRKIVTESFYQETLTIPYNEC